MPLVRRTRATLRSAEFGFLGVVVKTRVQTPRRWGEPFSAAVLTFAILSWRPFRTSCWIVGMRPAISSIDVLLRCRGLRWWRALPYVPAVVLSRARPTRPIPEVGRVAPFPAAQPNWILTIRRP